MLKLNLSKKVVYNSLTLSLEKKDLYDSLATEYFFKKRGIDRAEYYLMTCHRRENVHIRESFENILNLKYLLLKLSR